MSPQNTDDYFRISKISIAIIIIMVIIICIYVYVMLIYRIESPRKLINEVKFKTGDIILFKATNNLQSLVTGYFTHCGIIYVDGDVPWLFEAHNIQPYKLTAAHNNRGIEISDARKRISKYTGICYHKPLLKPLSADLERFKNFMGYCFEKFEYEQAVVANAVAKWLGLKYCNEYTDCGQLTFLSLIVLGLLKKEEYYDNRMSHLSYVCGLKTVCNNEYGDLVEVYDHPF